MFNFDIEKVVTPAVNSAKFFSSMIVVDSVRNATDSVIDANAAFVKTLFTECQKQAKATSKSA